MRIRSRFEDHDDLVARYVGKPDKKLVVKRRQTSCVFTNGKYALHVNGRVLINYRDYWTAKNEVERLKDKFQTAGIAFEED